MTYRVAFDISERIPLALLAVPASIALAVMLILLLRPASRAFLARSAWLWLCLAAALWSAFVIPNLSGPPGLMFGLVLSALALWVGVRAWRDDELRWFRDPLRARTAGPVIAAVILLVVADLGSSQWSAFDLERRLNAGEATVVTGVVTDHKTPNAGNESFRVNGHLYDYADSPTYVGFHQTSADWGPIRNGLPVRVTSIGDVIVRLEVADGY